MRKNRICLNAVSRKIPDSLSEDRLMFSSAGAQPISLKSFRGLGHFPNKIALVYKHEHYLPSAFRSWQVMRSGYRCALLARMASSGVGTHRICLLFCKKTRSYHAGFRKCSYTCCACYSPFPMLASAISQMEIGGNRRLVCQKAKRTGAVNGGAAVHLDH